MFIEAEVPRITTVAADKIAVNKNAEPKYINFFVKYFKFIFLKIIKHSFFLVEYCKLNFKHKIISLKNLPILFCCFSL